MARQGHSFATADDLRVIVRQPDGSFKDVPDDGVTLGEVAMRGNIVMKEVTMKDVPNLALVMTPGAVFP